MNAGIDYGLGHTNINQKTGIRYGVIAHSNVGAAWYEDAEADYGDPTCPNCTNGVTPPDEDSTFTSDYVCKICNHEVYSDEAYGDEPRSWAYNKEGIEATQSGNDTDIFVLNSPFYTICQLCSPCAPGAGYLMNPMANGYKAYCFPHDWFEDGKAPYPVYRVDTNEEVLPCV